MIKKILIGVDDSKYAEHAAEYGFNLAQSLNAHVGLVNIVEPMAIPVTGNGADEILGTPMQGIAVNNTDILDAQSQVSAMLLEHTAKKFGGKLQVHCRSPISMNMLLLAMVLLVAVLNLKPI
jgi:nucleotide-binding universal stress UspA family protein